MKRLLQAIALGAMLALAAGAARAVDATPTPAPAATAAPPQRTAAPPANSCGVSYSCARSDCRAGSDCRARSDYSASDDAASSGCTRAGDLRRFRGPDARHHLLGRHAHALGQGLLRRGWRHHRSAERLGDRRRLYVGGLLSRHFGAGVQLRILRPDLLDRLSRRLADHHVPDGRTVTKSRQVHIRRRRILSASGDADSGDGGDRHAGHGRVLSDRADGGRWPIDRTAVRPALPLRGRFRRHHDDHLCHLRRHDRHHLGADHQGGSPAVRRDADVAAGAR